MKQGTFALYSITASGKPASLTKALVEASIPERLILVNGNSLTIPRMTTTWRGDSEEQSWQEKVRAAIHEADPAASIVFDAREWEPAPGYPQGDLEL